MTFLAPRPKLRAAAGGQDESLLRDGSISAKDPMARHKEFGRIGVPGGTRGAW